MSWATKYQSEYQMYDKKYRKEVHFITKYHMILKSRYHISNKIMHFYFDDF